MILDLFQRSPMESRVRLHKELDFRHRHYGLINLFINKL
jgi:hypothetical protein